MQVSDKPAEPLTPLAFVRGFFAVVVCLWGLLVFCIIAADCETLSLTGFFVWKIIGAALGLLLWLAARALRRNGLLPPNF